VYAGVPIIRTEPIVTYKETIQASSHTVLSKSANKHNRLYLQAEPLPEDLADDIEQGKISPRTEPKERSKVL